VTRQTRRRLALAGAAAVLGIGSPLWGPALLRTVPAFNVAGIDVTGARYVPVDAARALAGILPDASAWDDHSEAAPALEPVDGKGMLLPLDPAVHALDLPILLQATVEAGRVADEDSRRVLAVMDRLDRLSPDFVRRVSEIHRSSGDAIELVLLEGSHAETVILPLDDADVAFLRAEDAISECADRGRVVTVDARFRGQVVVEIEEAA
jgi:hypothetical protein